MFDYAPVVTDRMALALMKQGATMDTGLYTRPFPKDAWIMVGMTILVNAIVFAMISMLSIYYRHLSKALKKVQRVVTAVAWLSFLLVEVYYEGALTMFFSTENGISLLHFWVVGNDEKF